MLKLAELITIFVDRVNPVFSINKTNRATHQTPSELSVQKKRLNFFPSTPLNNYTCMKCGEQCKIYTKKSAAIGYSFRCPKNKNHEKTILTNSYFKHGNVYPQDVLLFLRTYLIGLYKSMWIPRTVLP